MPGFPGHLNPCQALVAYPLRYCHPSGEIHQNALAILWILLGAKCKSFLFIYLQLVHITIVSFDLKQLHAILWIGSRFDSVYGELACNQVSKAES